MANLLKLIAHQLKTEPKRRNAKETLFFVSIQKTCNQLRWCCNDAPKNVEQKQIYGKKPFRNPLLSITNDSMTRNHREERCFTIHSTVGWLGVRIGVVKLPNMQTLSSSFFWWVQQPPHLPFTQMIKVHRLWPPWLVIHFWIGLVSPIPAARWTFWWQLMTVWLTVATVVDG